MLAQGRVEAAITSLVSANYFLSSGIFENRLQITTTVGDKPALIAMATSRKATELISILDKALSSIAPQELAAINNRWRSFTPSGGNWQDYQRQIYQIVLGLACYYSVRWHGTLTCAARSNNASRPSGL